MGWIQGGQRGIGGKQGLEENSAKLYGEGAGAWQSVGRAVGDDSRREGVRLFRTQHSLVRRWGDMHARMYA